MGEYRIIVTGEERYQRIASTNTPDSPLAVIIDERLAAGIVGTHYDIINGLGIVFTCQNVGYLRLLASSDDQRIGIQEFRLCWLDSWQV